MDTTSVLSSYHWHRHSQMSGVITGRLCRRAGVEWR